MSKELSKKLAELFQVSNLGRIEVLDTHNVSPTSFIKVFRNGLEHDRMYGLFEADFAEGTDTAQSEIEKHSKKSVKRFIEPLEADPDSDGYVATDGEWFMYLAELES